MVRLSYRQHVVRKLLLQKKFQPTGAIGVGQHIEHIGNRPGVMCDVPGRVMLSLYILCSYICNTALITF